MSELLQGCQSVSSRVHVLHVLRQVPRQLPRLGKTHDLLAAMAEWVKVRRIGAGVEVLIIQDGHFHFLSFKCKHLPPIYLPPSTSATPSTSPTCCASCNCFLTCA